MTVTGRAAPSDAEEILQLQKASFLTEAERYGDYSIPPLVQTLPELAREFASCVFLKAVADGRIVGSVNGREQEGTCHVARLIVHPEYRRRGIATLLMRALEREFAHVRRFELFTGHRSAGNIALYTRLGYRVFKTQPVSSALSFVFFEKIPPSR